MADTQDTGRSPNGSGHSAEPEPISVVSAEMASVPNAVEAELDLAYLAKLIDDATRAPWYIKRGLMGDDLSITAYEREGSEYTPNDKRDGPICHVSKEKHHFHTDKDHFGNPRGESRSWKTPIRKAEADANLIVAAVNALPELLRRLGYDGSETAWLIEWPADDYGPIRYWAAGRPQPVIDHLKATRFARKADAEAVMRTLPDHECRVAEHMWMAASAIGARSDATTKIGAAEGESVVPKPDAQTGGSNHD